MHNMQETSLSPSTNGTQDEEENVQETIQLCVFELSDRLFGLRIFDVQEIMEDAKITPVPTTPHFLRGVINLRGNIVPVVDIREILNLPVKPPSRESRIMILNIKKVRIGILVDAINEVAHIEKRETQTESEQIGISDRKFMSNIIQYKDGFLVLLDLEHLYQAIQL
jgi:purine-binding chemotaxis protein CheW